MYTLLTSVSTLASLCALTSAVSPAIQPLDNAQLRAPVAERRSLHQPYRSSLLQKRNSEYLNSNTEKFVVNGSNIPDVDFDLGESYAGLLPISSAANETRKLFFWFFPSSNPEASDEVTLWFNGGPGCSSLSGLLTENGPFTWEDGTKSPVQNPYTWTNLTNMLWVEQPVGVGYSQGVPNITDEVQLGDELAGFYKSFVDAFQVHGRKVYLTGESYAGFYVPYIANAFINANDTDYYNLKGIAINDPIIGDSTAQQEAVIVPYADYWSNLFYLNDSFIEAIHQKQIDCNYSSYLEKYLTFPPPAEDFPVLPEPQDGPEGANLTCDIFDDVYYAALLSNPCFNIYHITDTCPHIWAHLGIVNPGDYDPPGNQVYFNRSDVQAAINAPPTNWSQCTPNNVFGQGNGSSEATDKSLGPAQDGVLAHVIDFLNNTWIGSGELDYILPTNGTLLALQNVTWGGVKGFQKRPDYNTFYVPYHPEYNGGALSAAGDVGSWGYERGVTFYSVQLAGHELPGYAPGAGYRMLEAMLGRIKDLGEVSTFTTQKGNYTGPTAAEVGKLDERVEKFPMGSVFRHPKPALRV